MTTLSLTTMPKTDSLSEEHFNHFSWGYSLAWGAETPEAEVAINKAMRFVDNSMLGLAEEEAEAVVLRPSSVAKRLAIIEDGLAKYRRAIQTHPQSGLDSDRVQANVRGYLAHLLSSSGLSKQLTKGIMAEMPA